MAEEDDPCQSSSRTSWKTLGLQTAGRSRSSCGLQSALRDITVIDMMRHVGVDDDKMMEKLVQELLQTVRGPVAELQVAQLPEPKYPTCECKEESCPMSEGINPLERLLILGIIGNHRQENMSSVETQTAVSFSETSAPVAPAAIPVPLLKSEPGRALIVRVFLFSLIAASGAFLAVFLDAWTGRGMGKPTVWREISCSSLFSVFSAKFYGERDAIYASLVALGAAIGAAVGSFFGDFYGRRVALQFLATPSIIAWTIMLLIDPSGEGFYVDSNSIALLALCSSRFLAGISLGGITAVHPVYIVELAHPASRGVAGALLGVAMAAGLPLFLILRTFSPIVIPLVPTLPAFLVLAAFHFLPETPEYLSRCGKLMNALSVRRSFWGEAAQLPPRMMSAIGEHIQHDQCNIMCGLGDSGAVSVTIQSPFSTTSIIDKPTAAFTAAENIVAFETSESQTQNVQSSGRAQAIVYAASLLLCAPLFANETISFFVVLSNTQAASALAWLGPGTMQLLGALITLPFVDRAGRRPMIIASLAAVGVSHAALAVYYACVGEAFVFTEAGRYHPESRFCQQQGKWRDEVAYIAVWEPLMMALPLLALGIGTASLTWVTAIELLPPEHRIRASGALGVLRWITTLVMVHCFPAICSGIGVRQTFALLAILAGLSLVLAARLLPETRRRGLQQIQDELNASITTAPKINHKGHTA